MVFHSAVAAHQTCAVLCLSLLKELSEKLGELGEGEGGGLGEGRGWVGGGGKRVSWGREEGELGEGGGG